MYNKTEYRQFSHQLLYRENQSTTSRIKVLLNAKIYIREVKRKL